MNRLTLIRPDDWHLHLRDGDVLASVLPDTVRRFHRAIIMPNLSSPVTTLEAAVEYRDRILAALPEDADFEPLMTLYLTEATTPGTIEAAQASGWVHGVKLYPAGATTNAASGVSDIRRCYPVLETMQRLDLPLLVHGEVTDPDIDIFDREAVFIERHLDPLIRDFPELRVVLEHVTTESAVQFVESASARVAATITPQHLLLNRNALLVGGIQPHHYCLPVLKRERHRQALLGAVSRGHRRFFLGTDSAPHPRHAKESACGCAGIYSAHAAIELYAEAFDAVGALDRLEGFASHFGADFYKLPRNTDTITLERAEWTVPEAMLFGHSPGVPLRAGKTIAWQLLTH